MAADRAAAGPPLPDLADLNEDPDHAGRARQPRLPRPAACAPCHAARVAEFANTAHARACRRPADGPMPVGFEPGRGVYATAEPGLRSR